MRKLNVKLFLALVVGAALLVGAVFAVHFFQYKRIAAALLWQSRRAEEAGKVTQMLRYLQRYLEFAPHDLEERAHYGRVLATEAVSPRDRQQAIYVLDKVLRDDPGRRDLRRLLVKTALDLRQNKMAREHLKIFNETAKADARPDDMAERGELEGYWAQLLEAEKLPKEAIPYCREAMKHAPEVEANYVRLAYLLRRLPEDSAQAKQANAKEADDALDALVRANPTSAKAYLARWRYRREFDLLDLRTSFELKKLDEAGLDVVKAGTLAPEDVDVLIASADFQRLKNKVEEAKKYLRDGLNLQAKEGYKGASDLAQYQLLWHLADLLLDDETLSTDADKMAEVEDAISKIRKTRTATPPGMDYLEGRLLIQKREWARAVARLERCRPVLESEQSRSDLIGQIDFYLGVAYTQLEEPVQAAAAYQKVLEWNPNLSEARLGLAGALRKLGRLDEAVDQYRQAVLHARKPGEGWCEVARLEMLRQLQRDPEQRDWKATEQALAKADELADEAKDQKDNKDFVDPTLLRAELLALQNQLPEAETLLKQVRGLHPKAVELWTASADLAARRREKNDADAPDPLAVLDEAQKAVGRDAAELRVSRALHLAADPTEANRQAIDRLGENADDFSAEDQALLLGGLARAQLRAGSLPGARRWLQQLAQRPDHRTDLHLRLMLFDMALQEKDDAGMNAVLEEVQGIEGGDGAYSCLGRALRLVHLVQTDKKDRKTALDEASRDLERVEALRPSWSAAALARADVAELRGDADEVIKQLERATDLDGDHVSAAVLQRLLEALNRRQRYDEVSRYVVKLRRSVLANSGIGRLAAGVALREGNSQEAWNMIQDMKLESKDFRDHLLKARVAEAVQNLYVAEREYKAALGAAPQEPAVWVAYVQYLGNHDRYATGMDLIEHDMPAKLPADRVALAVAQCYESLGHTTKANERYEAVLKAQPDDPVVLRGAAGYYLRGGRLKEASPLLERLASKQVKASDADAEWARRGLAVVLASSTDYRDFRKALEYVGLKLDDNGQLVRETGARQESVEDRRAKARVLATQSQRQFRRKAIELLEGLQTQDQEDLFVLALLYDADGADAKEAEVLRPLVGRMNVRPAYLIQIAQLLIRQGKMDAPRFDEADKVITRLETYEDQNKLQRGVYATVELRVRLLEARDRGDEALALLRKHIERKGAKPEEILLLIASLGRQKKFDKAFELCEEAWTKCPPEMAGGVSVALLRAMQPSDEKINRVEGWLKTAIEKNPKVPVLKMHLADLSDLRGDYKTAAALYRQVLEEEPGNVVALNNLSWLLARQTGDGVEALKYIDRAVNGIGRRPDLLDTRGLANLSLGRSADAVADLMEATTEAPTPARLFHLAQAQMQARDRDGAVQSLRKAKALGLQPASLHPTERQTCQTLLNDLHVQ